MACTDYTRHERLLECTHTEAQTQIAVTFADGCSGRLCADCGRRLEIKRQPDVAERLPGPATALDLLTLIRAAGKVAS